MLSISDRCAIAFRAASLDDRLSWFAPPPPGGSAANAAPLHAAHLPSSRLQGPVTEAAPTQGPGQDVLEAWQQAFSPGDPESFRERLGWEGLDVEAVRLALADAAPPPRTAPAWTTWLLRFSQQAVALARDLSSGGMPTESGWIAARDEPPFLELWIPIVRAMRVELIASCRDLAGELTSPVRHAIERQWLADISFWGELAVYESFRAFHASPPASAAAPSLDPALDPAAVASLPGRTSTRYRAFVGEMLRDGLSPLFKSHAVLARLLATIAQTGVDAARELIVRLDHDRAAIAETFAPPAGDEHPLGPLVSLEPALSDPHDGRRRVMALQFANGLTLIYKPRDVGIERAWHTLLMELDRRGLPSAPPSLRVLHRNGYGWVEYARHEPLESQDDVRAYYRRAGALVFLSWLFGARDLHAENLVATRRGPVIVDAEMLLQPGGSGLSAPAAARPDATTCLDTGLLSLIHLSADGSIADIGGLRNSAVRIHDRTHRSATQRRWLHQRSDDLRYVDVPRHLPGLANVVSLDGVDQPVERFAEDVVQGFSEAYRFARGLDAPSLPEVPQEATQGEGTGVGEGLITLRFARCRTRVAFRPSEQYAALQRALAHPRFHRRGVLRSCTMDVLNRIFSASPARPRVWPLVEEERRALERLDIPRFTMRVDETSVTPGGNAGPIYAVSGLDALRDRLQRLSADDLARQTALVTDALTQSIAGRFHHAPPDAATTTVLPFVTAMPQSAASQSATSQTAASRAAASQPSASQASASQAGASRSAASHASASQASASQRSSSRRAESQRLESPPSESQPSESLSAGASAAMAFALSPSSPLAALAPLVSTGPAARPSAAPPSEPTAASDVAPDERSAPRAPARPSFADTCREHAVWIGRELLAVAEPTRDQRLAWPSHRFRLDPEGHALATHTLYDGTAGPALFFAALHAVTGDETWADATTAALAPLRQWIERQQHADDGNDRGRRESTIVSRQARATPSAPSTASAADSLPIGITGGLGSLVYSLTVIGRLARDSSCLDLAWRAAGLLTRERIAADDRWDLAGGAAGAIVALLALEREDGPHAPRRARNGAGDDGSTRLSSRDVEDRLAACGDRLVETQVSRPVGGAWPAAHGGFHVGFAHGAAGIGWALTLLHARLGRDAHRLAANRAFAFEQSQYVVVRENWPVLELAGAAAPLVPTWMYAWCHGAPGIELAHALARRPDHDHRTTEGAKQADTPGREARRETTSVASPPTATPTDHLCCGNAGRAEILLTLGQLHRDRGQLEAARAITAGLITRARARGHFRLSASGALYPVADPGFFQGLSGIGYHLLRMAAPDALPSVLAFETPATRAARPLIGASYERA